jgi:hypothetical protein
VRRYPAGGGAGVTANAGCDGTIAGTAASLSCDEAGAPAGSWQYTVTPVLGSWTGAESPKSTVVVADTGAPGLRSVTPQARARPRRPATSS